MSSLRIDYTPCFGDESFQPVSAFSGIELCIFRIRDLMPLSPFIRENSSLKRYPPLTAARPEGLISKTVFTFWR
ncbi:MULTISPECIES: hypothetical protein [unclassified Oceanispirochaeta]|uniref:hypothetical protein n=1 Tax=unclassified Oceanispirochaeta TaxID=2635722 RepID=UPI000E099F5D|nr:MULTISPECIES: hypothetical protein [unclassified Oceanispirochaeta]NPD71363.1 hypothetical protein [Oceanispirochaeta sp. M1]RDG33328.1 hypothetical protein DV872_04540 [Oceanispirochaeta sp. M1]